MSAIAAGAIVGGAALLGNMMSASSNSKTNRMNADESQLNREFQERMMNKQHQFAVDQWNREAKYNTDMWNKTNEYNSAKAQAARLREAGLNPGILMGGQNAGTAQSAPTPSGNSVGLPSGSAAQFQPYRYDFSGLGNALAQSYELDAMMKRNQAEINNLDAQSQVARARAAADTALTYERLKGTKLENAFFKSTMDVRRNQMNADYQQTLLNHQSTEQQIKLSVANTLLTQKELAIFDQQRAAGISNTIADTLLKVAQRQMTKQQAISEIQKMYKTAAEAQGIKISNDVAKRTADDIVEKASKDNSLRTFDSIGGVLGNIFNAFLGFGLGRASKYFDTKGGRKIVTYRKYE